MYKPFRIYDNKEKKYINNSLISDDIYESSYGDLFRFKKVKLGFLKFWTATLLSDERYIKQNKIGLYDTNGKAIYEGDICKTTDELFGEDGSAVCGIISYSSEYAQYLLFDHKTNKYYHLSTNVCKALEVIGNVNENPELLEIEENVEVNVVEESVEQEVGD